MALFSKKTTDTKKKAVNTAVTVGTVSTKTDYAHVLTNPRITEKATDAQKANVYVFDISPRATKRDIIRAIGQIYKVSPVKVNVVTYPSKIKRSPRTGKTGVKGGGRKAYVYLKKGETITVA